MCLSTSSKNHVFLCFPFQPPSNTTCVLGFPFQPPSKTTCVLGFPFQPPAKPRFSLLSLQPPSKTTCVLAFPCNHQQSHVFLCFFFQPVSLVFHFNHQQNYVFLCFPLQPPTRSSESRSTLCEELGADGRGHQPGELRWPAAGRPRQADRRLRQVVSSRSWRLHPGTRRQPPKLDCYWVESLDFHLLGNNGVFH